MIHFTQYVRPLGHKRPLVMEDVPPDVQEKADAITAAGFMFEIEELTTRDVHMTITGRNTDVASYVCQNREVIVRAHIFKLIRQFDIAAGKKADRECE